MPSDAAVRHTSEPTLTRIPDQLQQSKRPDAPVPVEVAEQQREPAETATQEAGILGQLETERAHD